MMMMLKTILLLSFLSQVRADESDEARAARLAQNRDHMAEVGDKSNVNDDDNDDDVEDDQHALIAGSGKGR